MPSKVWFITGVSRGFGRLWALAALERGDRVAATARDTSTLTDLQQRFGDAFLPLELDVTDREAGFARVAEAHSHFGFSLWPDRHRGEQRRLRAVRLRRGALGK
jgi:NADP-dependent 3-hydroxy acid dehydrogenase YdfG